MHPLKYKVLESELLSSQSRAFSREAVGPFISSSRQKSNMSKIGIVVVFVDDGK